MNELRIACVVPGCRRTCKPMYEGDEEWICNKHYATIPLSLRREYEAAWHDADRAEKAGFEDVAAFSRVTQAFKRCRAEVGA